MQVLPNLFFTLFFLLPLTVFAQIKFSGSTPQNIHQVLFTNYATGDTLYLSTQCTGVCNVNGLRYHEALVLTINGNKKDKKRITVDLAPLELKIYWDSLSQTSSLSFDSQSYNYEYFSFLEKQKPADLHLKQMMATSGDPTFTPLQKDSIGKEIGKLINEGQLGWYNFFLQHPQSFLALDFVLSELQFSDMPKEKLKLIFDKLNPEFSEYPQWSASKSFFESKLPPLKNGDSVPDMLLYSLKNQDYNLHNLTMNKEAYLIFWAGWCKGCISELNHYQLDETLMDSLDIKLIPINITCNNDSTLINKFHSYLLKDGLNNTVLRQFGMNALPFGVLISENHKLLGTGYDLVEILKHRKQ